MVAHSPFPRIESTTPTISGSTPFSQPGLSYCPSYLNSQVVSSPVSLFAPSSFPLFQDVNVTSTVDCTPPFFSTSPLHFQSSMDVSNASSLSVPVPVPVLSTHYESTAILSSPLSDSHPHYVTQATGLPHFANYFPDSIVDPDTPLPGPPHHFVPVSGFQNNPEAWCGYSLPSLSRGPQGNADSGAAHSYHSHQAPSYPHLYDSAYFWNDWQVDCHSYWPSFQIPESAAPHAQCEDAQHPTFPPYFPSDHVFTQSARTYGKDFPGADWVNEDGQAETIIVTNNRKTNFHCSPDDRGHDRGSHQKGHIIVNDSKVAITNKECNSNPKNNREGSHRSSVGGLSDQEKSHSFFSEKTASVSDDVLAASIAPLSKSSGENHFTIYKSNLFGNQVKTIMPFYPKQGNKQQFNSQSMTKKDVDSPVTKKDVDNLRPLIVTHPFYGSEGSVQKEAGGVTSLTSLDVPSNEVPTAYSGSSLRDSGNISQPGRGSLLDKTQPFSVHMASSGQFSQLESLSDTRFCWPPKCDSLIPSDLVKSKSSLDFMKQETLKQSVSKTQGNIMPDLSHNYLSFLDTEASLADEKHAAFQQGFSDGGMKNVWHDIENTKPNAFLCQNFSAISKNEIALDALRKKSEVYTPSSDAGYAISSDSSEGSKLNLLQIEQEVYCGEDCNKSSSVWKSSTELDNKPFEATCQVIVDMDQKMDSCKVKPLALNYISKEIKESFDFLPSSVPLKESRSYYTKDCKDDFAIQVDAPVFGYDGRQNHQPMHPASEVEVVNKTGFSPCGVGGNLDLQNPLQDCCSLDNKLQSSNSQATKISCLRLVNESIFNLTEVLLAHCQSHSCNAADASDLSILQSSIKNLSQYLLFEIGNGERQNLLSSSKLCGQEGTSGDRPPFDGTKEAGCQGKKVAKHWCGGNLCAHFLKETCLQHNFSLGRNCCDNFGDVRLCCLADSNQVESFDPAKQTKVMDAEISVKEEQNGAANINLDIKDEATSHDLGAARLELCIEEYEVQLHKMKALLDSVRQNPKQSTLSESSAVEISNPAHQQKLTETGFACSKNQNGELDSELLLTSRTLSRDDLQNFNMEFRDEVKKLQELLENSTRQLSQKHLKDTESSSLWSWLMTNHMLRTANEIPIADKTHPGITDGRMLMAVRNINEAEFEEKFIKAGWQANLVSDMNLDPEPACTTQKGCQLDDTVRQVNSLTQQKLIDPEEKKLQTFYQDDIVSVHLKQDETNTCVPDCSRSNIESDDRKLRFEERHVMDDLEENGCKGPVQSQSKGFEKPDKATTKVPVYPDMKQAELRLAILKARHSESKSSFTTENVTPTKPFNHTLSESRSSLIRDNYFENPREHFFGAEHLNVVMQDAGRQDTIRCSDSLISTDGITSFENSLLHVEMNIAADNLKSRTSIPHSAVDFCVTSKQDHHFADNGACERGDIDHEIEFGPHPEVSFCHSTQNFNAQVDQEKIIYKPEHRLESPSELEDAGWEKVHENFT